MRQAPAGEGPYWGHAAFGFLVSFALLAALLLLLGRPQGSVPPRASTLEASTAARNLSLRRAGARRELPAPHEPQEAAAERAELEPARRSERAEPAEPSNGAVRAASPTAAGHQPEASATGAHTGASTAEDSAGKASRARKKRKSRRRAKRKRSSRQQPSARARSGASHGGKPPAVPSGPRSHPAGGSTAEKAGLATELD